MKYKTLVLGCLIFCSTSFVAKSLTLTDKEGSVTECSIKSYNPLNGTVGIMVKGQRMELPFSKFTAESQQKICSWLADIKFKSSSGLRIKIDDDVEKTDTSKSGYKEETETTVYALNLRNASPIDLKDIEIEYFVFYEQEKPGSKEKAQKFCTAGTMSCDLAPDEQSEFKTTPVSVKERTLTFPEGSTSSYYVYPNGASNTSEGQVKGVLFRVTKPSLSGKLLIRDVKKGRVPKEKDRGKYSGYRG